MSNVTGYQGSFIPAVPATIANAATESSVISLGGMTVVGIFLPAAFTGTALTFLVSPTLGGTYIPLLDGETGDPVTLTVAQGNYYAVDGKYFQGVQFLKVKSGTTETGARTLNLALKG